MTLRVGVDAGGTFTDVCVLGDDGSVTVHKLASTPTDASGAIIEGVLAALVAAGSSLAEVAYFGHGTTVATNALLELNGARTGVITTQGFRDLLELARQQRPDLYDLQADKPVPLARRRHRIEVPERMRYDGSCEQSLDEASVRAAARFLHSEGVQSVAVCLLYSYLYSEHERRIGELLAEELPEAYVSLSHRVLAEFREYERLSSTVVNAYLGPMMSAYIDRLGRRIAESGGQVEPYITQSNGGLISLAAAATLPVRTVLSGPAAGVVGAAAVARSAGIPNVITFDMGGTSTDVALIEDYEPHASLDLSVNGYPVRTPMLDINTVGAGGGSVAWIDSGRHLKVGPRSAGADPGPAGYGRGGVEATVSDANLVLGALNREQLLDGQMKVDADAADTAVARLAGELRLSSLDVAGGILAIVTANMARAIRVISIDRGYDPRDFALVAFGGAGPLHAARLARELDIPTVIVPPTPGILCAIGLPTSDLRSDYSRTVSSLATVDALPRINAALAELVSQAVAWFEHEGVDGDGRRLRRFADMRYVGQNFELMIELDGEALDATSLTALIRAFDVAHERAYGFAAPGEVAQVVTLRLEAHGAVETVHPAALADAPPDSSPPVRMTRDVFLTEVGEWVCCDVYARASLLAGHVLVGPAIIEQMDSTTLVLQGQRALVDRAGNLIISESEGAGA